ncbi:MAG: putative bifunctional diguanylate cyclase/phosphodiesterase [Hyphomicrobiales bacterium]
MSDPQPATLFSFREAASDGIEAAPSPVEKLSRIKGMDDGVRIQRALAAANETAYHWIVESDEIAWSGNAAEVLGCAPEVIATGRAYAAYLDADNFASRYDTVMRSNLTDDGGGVPFQIEYLFRPEGRQARRAIWVEDHGRWYCDANGRPAEVFGTVRRIDDRHQRDQHLSFLGNCDALTGMMNRGRLAEALGEAISVAQHETSSCAFLIAAINNLPVVNEAYGFEVADDVVAATARRLRQVVRTGDAIARYSGSKFGIILNKCDEDELQVAAERFLAVARESVIETERGPVWAMLSIGALVMPKHATSVNTAMARAEEALTGARHLPSDGYVIFAPSEQRMSERSLNARFATEIVRCLKDDRFSLAYQPIVDARTGAPVMYEALLRMVDAGGEPVEARHLIPVAEKLGLVRLIDRAVVQMSLAALNKYPDARISLNVSGTTATDPRWFRQLIDMMSPNRIVTGRLTVEITETIALGELRETARFVEQLRDLGCSVAIDDFGAGFTSFRNLRALPVDILKLDGSFCQGLKDNDDNRYFVRSLIDLAHKFGLKAVAEWVETGEDAELLRRWGVDYLQGNHFGAALVNPPWQRKTESSRFEANQYRAAPQPLAGIGGPAAEPEEGRPALSSSDAFSFAGHDPAQAEAGEFDMSRLHKAIEILDGTFGKPRAPAEIAGAGPSYADLATAPAGQAAL